MAQGEAKSSFQYNNCLVNAAMIDLEGIMSMIKVSRNISSFMCITHNINLFLVVVFFFFFFFFLPLKYTGLYAQQTRSTLGRIRNMGGAGRWNRGK